MKCTDGGPGAYNEECTFTCDQGFYGDTKVTCTDDGTDDGTGSFGSLPTCTGKLQLFCSN